MVLKKVYHALERLNFVGVKFKKGQVKLIKIPKKLLEEIESFSERNSLAVVASRLKDKSPIYSCCPQCLKAHLTKSS